MAIAALHDQAHPTAHEGFPMHASTPLQRTKLAYVPAFPPLPIQDRERPKSRPMTVYCPTRPRRDVWPSGMTTQFASSEPGAVSVGHGIGSRGNEGTAADRGTGAPGSNLTRDETMPSPAPAQRKPSHTDGSDGSATEGLLDGTRKGPAQP
jgi:hypothetical protein